MAPTKYKMGGLDAELEKLNDGVGFVHECVTFCQLNKAGYPTSRDFAAHQGGRGEPERGHDGISADLGGLELYRRSLRHRSGKSEPE
jgi:hypothetical protein